MAGFEFPFVELEARGKPIDELLVYAKARWPWLLDVATTLRQHGWVVNFALTGLWFDRPAEPPLGSAQASLSSLLEGLKELGISGDSVVPGSRTLQEVQDEEQDCLRESELGDPDPFEAGKVEGIVSALRWVLGVEWDNMEESYYSGL